MPADEETFDVVIVGSGGGGLIGAYAAAARGLRTVVLEKTALLGGTTAYSGAGLWFPGSAPIRRAGFEDDADATRTYLRDVVADSSREPLQDAYLRTAPRLIDELEQNPIFGEFIHMPVPEYFAASPGASPTGHSVFPPEIPIAELGELAELIRRSIPEERWGDLEGPTFSGGRALIGRALKALLDTGNGSYRLETAMTELVVSDGRVTGVVAVKDGIQRTFHATRGVLLAAGGFEHNREMREQYSPVPLTGEWSNGAPENTGDAILAGRAAGAATDLMDEAWYIPGLVWPEGRPVFHSGTRGGIYVNADGERFTNEAQPYDRAGHAMVRAELTTGVSHTRNHWVFDHHQLERDGMGSDPAGAVQPEWFSSGALRKAETLEELAELIGVPPQALRKSVEEFNGYAKTGVDERFHRGETPWDRMLSFIVGYPAHPRQNYIVPLPADLPNPLLIPIDTPPYYAATIVLSDIGTKGGLVTDDHARVQRPDGTTIEGLYATGNTMAAMSGGAYPGAGTPIGSSLVFAYLAALDLAEAPPTD
ncbi:FAD-binding protein [Nocardia sp. NPDC006630]|uniref:FAD-binding protein n=1 Tax=Nocardia sp. NPDC006630 TaxID=3157181 RepID=UPI0033A5975E